MPTPDATRPGGSDELSAIFGALADPVRRTLVEELIAEPRRTPTSLAAGLPITRQAVAKHLATLTGAGIVQSSRAGREVRYEVTPDRLTPALEWIGTVGAEWDERLKKLSRLLEKRTPA